MQIENELVFRLSASAVDRLTELLVSASSEAVQFRLIEARHILGSRKTDAAVEILVTLGLGVTSSLVASAIYALVANAEVKPTNGNITINNITISIDSNNVEESIENALKSDQKPKAHDK